DLNFIWIVEMAQFTMASYYILGGGYSIILKGHVRMDLLYGKWTEKGRAIADVLTSFFLIFYLVLLLYGAISSTQYALEYGQKNYSSWGPPMAPIKIIMTIGIVLMLLQAVAVLFRDIATSRGEEIA
ncbi:MAG TPA: TRAP transporter small permease subunit, partial [Deltaproteobacteria bacterium]|nr:TRAP transporter small permease subunit [Deltaproteobacteria bacterium]